jgi:hypothetical protein
MEWVESLLSLLFKQLGPLGTVCLLTTVYAAWLHKKEKDDHLRTRELVAMDAEKRNKIHQEFIAVLVEIKTMLAQTESNRHG